MSDIVSALLPVVRRLWTDISLLLKQQRPDLTTDPHTRDSLENLVIRLEVLSRHLSRLQLPPTIITQLTPFSTAQQCLLCICSITNVYIPTLSWSSEVEYPQISTFAFAGKLFYMPTDGIYFWSEYSNYSQTLRRI